MNTVEIRTDGAKTVTLFARSGGKPLEQKRLELATHLADHCLLVRGQLVENGGIRVVFDADPREGRYGPCSAVVSSLLRSLGWDKPTENPAIIVCQCEQCVITRTRRQTVACVGDT